ncbi:MAG: channel, pore region [Candidatus Solibacter sp.]|jgi:hypothetical protein|nr:channel, pore region [Candidatus Solibacter sp.]
MRVLAAILGVIILALVLVDAFNTLVLARRTQHIFRIARLYYRMTWGPTTAIARRIQSSKGREAFLAIYGPLSMLLLIALWAVALITAFGLVQWSAGMQPAAMPGTFANDLYLSASTLFTLSSGDPQNPVSKVIAATQAGLGFGFLGLVVSYLPVLYESFAKRESRISMLDARAGSPPSAGALLQDCPVAADNFEDELAKWEEWFAQLLENQLSFPMLGYFRSQHSNQAWLTALVAVVDCAAVVSLCAKNDLQRQADLTFAMGRHALADIAVVFGLEKASHGHDGDADRLTESDFAALQQVLREHPALFDASLCTPSRLKERRKQYEPQAAALSDHFLMALPSWRANEDSLVNWKASMENRSEVPYAVSDPFSEK